MAELNIRTRETLYILELNELELKMIYALTGRVGGTPGVTYRDYAESIYKCITEKTGWYYGNVVGMLLTKDIHAGEYGGQNSI